VVITASGSNRLFHPRCRAEVKRRRVRERRRLAQEGFNTKIPTPYQQSKNSKTKEARVNDKEMLAAIETVEHNADPLTKAWWRELLRIGALTDRRPWEDALLDLTIEIESTVNKIRDKKPLNSYDRLLVDILRLLELPNPQDPKANRDMALARLVEREALHSEVDQ
jgi:hypothetical protein